MSGNHRVPIPERAAALRDDEARPSTEPEIPFDALAALESNDARWLFITVRHEARHVLRRQEFADVWLTHLARAWQASEDAIDDLKAKGFLEPGTLAGYWRIADRWWRRAAMTNAERQAAFRTSLHARGLSPKWRRAGRVAGVPCWLCDLPIHRPDGCHDHVLARSAGGPDDPSNLRPAHLLCNGIKGRRQDSDDGHRQYVWARLARRSEQTGLTVPALLGLHAATAVQARQRR